MKAFTDNDMLAVLTERIFIAMGQEFDRDDLERVAKYLIESETVNYETLFGEFKPEKRKGK